MIADKCFRKEWLALKRKEMKGVDPALLEKCIHAFALLCGLSSSSIPFVFKGGTSLVMLLKEIHRLSIDIDIVTLMPRVEYELILAEIGYKPPFLGYKQDDRGERGLPHRTHFKFFYNSIVSQRRENVLLDILEEKDLYPKTQACPIRASFIELDKPVKVSIPVTECLLGDKLIAFAPNTTGIRYGKKSSMQIIKQLFDIGELFNAVDNLTLIRKTYKAFSEAEINYRGGRFTSEEAMEDTFRTSLLICGLGLRGMPRDKHTEILMEGISKISSYIVNTRFRLEEAKIFASRVALLAVLLRKSGIKRGVKEFRWDPKHISELTSLTLKPPLDKLNRIKATIPEAFYNLYQIQAVE